MQAKRSTPELYWVRLSEEPKHSYKERAIARGHAKQASPIYESKVLSANLEALEDVSKRGSASLKKLLSLLQHRQPRFAAAGSAHLLDALPHFRF